AGKAIKYKAGVRASLRLCLLLAALCDLSLRLSRLLKNVIEATETRKYTEGTRNRRKSGV
ncbi:hypothetical protein WH50_10155, partial [Pokkaliibacter plantistimulans]